MQWLGLWRFSISSAALIRPHQEGSPNLYFSQADNQHGAQRFTAESCSVIGVLISPPLSLRRCWQHPAYAPADQRWHSSSLGTTPQRLVGGVGVPCEAQVERGPGRREDRRRLPPYAPRRQAGNASDNGIDRSRRLANPYRSANEANGPVTACPTRASKRKLDYTALLQGQPLDTGACADHARSQPQVAERQDANAHVQHRYGGW